MSTTADAPPSDSRGPLAGIRVLELANVIAGPSTGQLLGDFGAEIIKFEHPELGDGSRRQGKAKDGVPLWWKMLGRNKRSVGMYLGDKEAAGIFLELVAKADVVIEGFRPGTLEKWGLGYDRLSEANPGIILARLTGFGQTGPYRDRPAFGSNIEALAGLPHLTGNPDGPPTMSVYALGDYMGSLSLANAILMALYHRDARGGKGQVIDAALLSPLLTMMSHAIMMYDQLGTDDTRTGNRSNSNAPRNIYRTRDNKWVSVAAATTPLAARIMEVVGRPDLIAEPWFRTGAGRAANVDVVDKAVADWIGARDRDEVMRTAFEAELTFAPVYSIGEMTRDPHIEATSLLERVPDGELGSLLMPGLMFQMSETPGAVRWTGPALGNATEEVLCGELGLPADRLEALRARGVVR
jgi:crotonobetainyl-CoA:carnitine CoA-transferase CaiB-like acyl-CoA transferase